jgi:hypothetical protein
VMKGKQLFIIRIIIGVVFILSAISKLKSTGLFEITLIDQGFISDRLIAAYFSRILISVELFIGLAFFQPFLLKRVVAPLTLISLTIFSIYLGNLLISVPDAENCGCFGEMVKLSPLESLLKNIVLIGLVLYFFIKAESKKGKLLIPILLLIACFTFVFGAFPIRLLENNAFAKYTHFEPVGLVDLTQGDNLIAVLDVNCEHCQAAARELGKLDQNTDTLPPIYFLIYGEDESANSVQYFFNLTSTNFPYHKIGEDEFFDLIGSAPPRIYWLQNGKIKAQWDEDFIDNLAKAFNVSE